VLKPAISKILYPSRGCQQGDRGTGSTHKRLVSTVVRVNLESRMRQVDDRFGYP